VRRRVIGRGSRRRCRHADPAPKLAPRLISGEAAALQSAVDAALTWAVSSDHAVACSYGRLHQVRRGGSEICRCRYHHASRVVLDAIKVIQREAASDNREREDHRPPREPDAHGDPEDPEDRHYAKYENGSVHRLTPKPGRG
jgi:hypothetical protein